LIVLPLFLVFITLTLFPVLPQKAAGFYKKYVTVYSSFGSFQEFTLGFGVWAPVAFFLAQLFQIVIAPIPGNIVALVGGALFGVVKGLLLSAAGQISGSLIAFFLARKFGKPLVLKLIGRVTYDRYNRVFSGRFVLILFLIFLLPFFPDDALCFLAGLSALPLFFFLILVIFGRLPGIVVATLAGAGVINLSMTQWILTAVFSLVLIGLIFKYRRLIEEWLSERLGIGLDLSEEKEDKV
jgi:uncharacterized membrane protein YdjX (TVP38/TMEM64 family)